MLYDLEENPREMTSLLGTNPARKDHVFQANQICDTMDSWMERVNHPYVPALKESELG